MKRLIVVAMLVLLLTGCASRYSAPAADVQFAHSAGQAVVAKFLEHYKKLFDDQRPPSEQEYGYWLSTYENLKAWYQFLLSKVREDRIDPETLKEIAGTLFGVM